MDSVFNEGQISYALEKFGDFIRGSGTDAHVPGWGENAAKVVIDSLEALREKLQTRGHTRDMLEEHLGAATYAINQLHLFVSGDKSDIPNKTAARVFRDFLWAEIRELQEVEHEHA